MCGCAVETASVASRRVSAMPGRDLVAFRILDPQTRASTRNAQRVKVYLQFLRTPRTWGVKVRPLSLSLYPPGSERVPRIRQSRT